ncbi:glycosyltransferase family 2 protein [Blastopirellula marina]|uniref:Glycosyltransferase family 2 protein n=1 Tax=Blastopirellula marina TaxID=124 RepID=A0A2S8GHG9_9BACT|nr:glycosyltransferase family 2 protein [Blastopirellula marina]PQO43905.1 glycosyltransferase family 2 protein [Blastopirellula marina]
MTVSIIVVSYNTCEETLACLESVYAQTLQTGFELIVVDNASTDGSAAAIAERFPEVRLIASADNLGFAGANNAAAKEATGEYLLLLNPDTVILDNAIDRVVAFARENPRAGLYGGRTFFGDMTLNANSCHGEPTPWSLLCMGLGLSALFRRSALLDPESLGSWDRNDVREVDCITGCFLLIRRQIWEQLEGFDLEFFMYGEDTDLCIRARKLGAKCLICPDATLIHYGGRSEKIRGDKMIRLFRAKNQLFRKHWSPWAAAFGSGMLSLWAFTRYCGASFLGLFKAKYRSSAGEWGSVFRRRREFASVPVAK